MGIKARDTPNMLTITQVAERLSFNPWTIREMLRNGEIKGSRIRNRWRVKVSDLEEFIERKSNKK